MFFFGEGQVSPVQPERFLPAIVFSHKKNKTEGQEPKPLYLVISLPIGCRESSKAPASFLVDRSYKVFAE